MNAEKKKSIIAFSIIKTSEKKGAKNCTLNRSQQSLCSAVLTTHTSHDSGISARVTGEK
jgi:hypothetical protein